MLMLRGVCSAMARRQEYAKACTALGAVFADMGILDKCEELTMEAYKVQKYYFDMDRHPAGCTKKLFKKKRERAEKERQAALDKKKGKKKAADDSDESSEEEEESPKKKTEADPTTKEGSNCRLCRNYAASLNSLASLFRTQARNTPDDRPKRKKKLLKRAIKMLEEEAMVDEHCLDGWHENHGHRYNNLAACYLEMRKFRESEVQYLKACIRYSDILGRRHKDTRACLQDLQELYDRSDQNFKIAQLGQKDGMSTLLRQAEDVLAAKKEAAEDA